jgi:hypothetical protein
MQAAVTHRMLQMFELLPYFFNTCSEKNTKWRLLSAILKINKFFPIPKSPAEIGFNNDQNKYYIWRSLNKSYIPGLSVGGGSSEAGTDDSSSPELTTTLTLIKLDLNLFYIFFF